MLLFQFELENPSLFDLLGQLMSQMGKEGIFL